MGPFLGVCGFFGIIVSLILICIRAIRKQPKKNASISLMVCFILLMFGVVLDPKDKEKDTKQAAVSATEEAFNRSIPDDSSGEVVVEVTTEDIITEASTEQKASVSTEEIESLTEQKAAVIDLGESKDDEYSVEETKEIIDETTTEEVTESTTEAETEATTEEITTEEITTEEEVTEVAAIEMDYILNTNTRKFHKPSCKSVKQMKEKNKEEYHGTREDVIGMGYEPCKNCNP